MEKPTILTIVSLSNKGYSGYTVISKGNAIYTDGKTLEELKIRTLEGVNKAFKDRGIKYTVNDIHFKDENRMTI